MAVGESNFRCNSEQDHFDWAYSQARGKMLDDVDISNHPWLSSLPEHLTQRMLKNPRLKARLYESLATYFGEPFENGDFDGKLATFLGMDRAKMREAAICAGLAFHISTAADVLDRETISILESAYGHDTLQFALQNAISSIAGSSARADRLADMSETIEADGMSMLQIWARAKGIDPAWKADTLHNGGEGPPLLALDTTLRLVENTLEYIKTMGGRQ